MKAEQFCYWLQGYFEIAGEETIESEKIEIIKNHLNLVFVHDLDPKQEEEFAEKTGIDKKDAKKVLNYLHNPKDPNTIFRC